MSKAWKQVSAEWREVVLVCRKCSKKIEGGFGPGRDMPLAKALHKSLAHRNAALRKPKPRRRRTAVIEVGCLDICPRNAVVAVRAADPGRWLLVPDGADLDEVALRLGLAEAASPGVKLV